MTTYSPLAQTLIQAVKSTALLGGLVDDLGSIDIDYLLPPKAEEMSRPVVRLDGFTNYHTRLGKRSFYLKLWMPSGFSTEEVSAMLDMADAMTEALRNTGSIRALPSLHRPQIEDGLDCVVWLCTTYL